MPSGSHTLVTSAFTSWLVSITMLQTICISKLKAVWWEDWVKHHRPGLDLELGKCVTGVMTSKKKSLIIWLKISTGHYNLLAQLIHILDVAA